MAEEEGLLSKKAHLSLGTLYAMPWAPPSSVSGNHVVLYFLRHLKFDIKRGLANAEGGGTRL